ncbi:MAG: acyl carrier protein [Caulobacterales bacterium]
MAAYEEELLALVAEEALVDTDKLVKTATLEDIGLDSIDLVSIVFAVEERYGVEITEDAFARTDTLGQVLDKLQTMIAARGG